MLVTTLTKRMAEDLTEYLADHGTGALSALGLTPWSGWKSSRPAPGKFDVWWASTCCAKDSICRRSPWWPFWMRIKRASCVPPLPHPDHRPGSAQPQRQGDPLRGPTITNSHEGCDRETERRRARSTPQPGTRHRAEGLNKAIGDVMDMGAAARGQGGQRGVARLPNRKEYHARSASEISKEIKRMEEQMFQHARDLEFEQAAALRDQIQRLRGELIESRAPDAGSSGGVCAASIKAFATPGTPWWAKGLVILILLYGISPVDVVPDVVPLLGWLDDATLLLLLLWGWEKCLPGEVLAAWTRPSEQKPTFRERGKKGGLNDSLMGFEKGTMGRL